MAATLFISFPPPTHLSHLTLPTRVSPKLSFSTPAKFSRIPSWVTLHGSSQLLLSPPSTATPHGPTHRGQGQDVVANVHLVSLCKNGRFQEARKFLRSMEANGVRIKTHFFEHLFNACGAWSSITDGKIFHKRIKMRLGREPDGFLGACLVKMYCECSCLQEARAVFDGMTVKSPTAWRNLVIGHARDGYAAEAISLLSEMRARGISPDKWLVVMLVTGLTEFMNIELAKQVHSFVIKIELEPNVSWETALVNMYVKCECLHSAELLFDRMEETNAITWTSLMVGCAEQERFENILSLFQKMLHRDVDKDPFVISIVLKACSALGSLETGKQIHGLCVKVGMDSSVSAGTPIVDLYVKCGCIKYARLAFERISEPNEHSWSSLFSGYCQMGQLEESFGMFEHLRNREAILSSFIYTSIFQVCAVFADSISGSQLHCDAIKRGLISELHGKSALVMMYWKSGNLEYAHRIFKSMDKLDTVAWTAIIAGCAYHGHATEALRLFSEMQCSDIRPNSQTLTAVFTACGHSGLVSQAKKCLEKMENIYGVEPTVEHYNCMVDIYCRAGILEEAFKLIKSCTFLPDALTWKILLRGSTNHSNLEIGKFAIEHLLQIETHDSTAYVMSLDFYVAAKRWEEATFVRKLMNDRGIRKEIDCCYLTVKGEVHRFCAGDWQHPRREEVHSKLKEMTNRIANLGFVPPVGGEPYAAHDEGNDQSIDHVERLATTFGLFSMPSSGPITILKNRRICGDCHSFIKIVSSITMREIIIRDSDQFHCFKNGTCSCKDYW